MDRTVLVDHLVFEDRGYILSRADGAGGRGINASRVLAFLRRENLGHPDCRRRYRREDPGIARRPTGSPVHFVPITSESRTNLTISDKQGLTVKLNELGPPLDESELEALKRDGRAPYQEGRVG